MKREGLTIIVTIAMIGLVAVFLLVLAEVSNSLAFESDRGLAQARQRNLAASATAWLRQNRTKSAEELAKGVDLDPAALSGEQLRIQVAADGRVEVTTRTRAGRLTLNGSAVFLPAAQAGPEIPSSAPR